MKELIKELFDICDRKGLFHGHKYNLITVVDYLLGLNIVIDLMDSDRDEQLQAAIDKVKSL